MTPPYTIAPAVFAQHPGYCRGVLVFDGVDNRGDAAALAPDLRDAEAAVRNQVRGNVAEHARIAAWRDAFRRFGARPSDFRSSIEAMVRRVLQPSALPSINPLVDIGNIVSLRHLLPAGVHPLPTGPDALALRPAQAGDRFLPAEGSPAEEPPAGEIVFTQGSEVLTRRWTWRQAADTQTLAHSSRVFFNIDGLPPASRSEVQAAMQAVQTLVLSHCGGRLLRAAVIDAAHPTVEALA